MAVCEVRSSVYRIESFEIYGSAVRIADDLLVTNRHVVADEKTVKIFLDEGTVITGQVIPTSYQGDLVLIQATLPDGKSARIATDLSAGELRTIGYDIGSKAVKVYPPGQLLIARDPNKAFARHYHTAPMRSGNSGGAVVTSDGLLAGVVASGGEGRFEAIPSDQINAVKDLSDDQYAEVSQSIGKAYRECVERIETILGSRTAASEETLDQTADACKRSKNRQLIDIAAQAYGRARQFDKSADLLLMSLERDPNAINTMLSLVITLHFAQRYSQELPYLERLLDIIPEEPSLHRMAIQAGKSLGNEALVDKGLELTKKYNPRALEAAEKFLGTDKPQQSPRPSR